MDVNDGVFAKLISSKEGGLQKLTHGNDGGLQKLTHGNDGILQKLIHANFGTLQKLIIGNDGILQKLTHGNLKLQMLIHILGTINLTDDGKLPSITILEINLGIMKLIGGIGGGGSILISLTLIKLGILLLIVIILGIVSVGTSKITEGIEIGPN